jgi:hypothetical protein
MSDATHADNTGTMSTRMLPWQGGPIQGRASAVLGDRSQSCWSRCQNLNSGWAFLLCHRRSAVTPGTSLTTCLLHPRLAVHIGPSRQTHSVTEQDPEMDTTSINPVTKGPCLGI